MRVPFSFNSSIRSRATGKVFAGLGALLDTAAAECSYFIARGGWRAAGALAPAEVGALLDAEARHPLHRRVRLDHGRRLVRTWVAPRQAPLAPPAWRDSSVYLITGGMGGLGRLLAREILTNAKSPVLVLTGTSPLDQARRSVLDDLHGAGARARYHQVDVSDAAAVGRLVAETGVRRDGGAQWRVPLRRYAAGSDTPQQDAPDLDAVLAPKVHGALALADACKGLTLDCFVLFSSLAGAVGNLGQGDYAAANGFLDAFAEILQGTLPAVSVNWPLWRDGGMRIDTAGQETLFETMGQRPLSSEAGIAALGAATCLRRAAGRGGCRRRTTYSCLLRCSCHQSRSGRRYRENAGAFAAAFSSASGAHDRALRHLLSRVSGVTAASIEAETPLDAYGIDSLMITRLNQELGDVFGTLSAALLFEHRTLAALARHLTERHPDGCRRLMGEDAQAGTPRHAISAPENEAQPTIRGIRANSISDRDPIAIIGMSGRYPGAEDLDAYWDNLAAGRDLIGEVPPDRWPLAGFFEPDIETAVSRGQRLCQVGRLPGRFR